jgi:RNA polymerase sigma-70 factor, ECF subfamily
MQTMPWNEPLYYDASFVGDTADAEKRTISIAASDAQLVAAALSGNEGGFSILLERHLPMVYKFVYRYAGNADDANDIAQETFIKVWKHLKRFDAQKNFKTWVLTIAKNTALDFLKKKKPLLFSKIEEQENGLDAFLAPYVAGADSPEQVFETKNTKKELEASLLDIPPSYRTVLVLRYNEHLKFREIAEMLGEPIDTVKSKHRRGLLLLRKVITE